MTASPVDVARLEALEAQATSGPWHHATNRHPTTDGQPWGAMDSPQWHRRMDALAVLDAGHGGMHSPNRET